MAEQLNNPDGPEDNVNGQVNAAETLQSRQASFALKIHTAFPEPERFIDSPSSARQFESPVTMYCHGDCRKDPNWILRDSEPIADVVSLNL